MDAIKQYTHPKWVLTGVGILFTIFTLLTYAEISNAAETKDLVVVTKRKLWVDAWVEPTN